ncbi:hypothetical protein ACEXQB_006815 [Herbiconiux sp. P18]|uniref:hypothetical protein n=1 Tax=Herbiconiux liangxiaofengii TaxID=3342795 RepID=UPI0035B6C327
MTGRPSTQARRVGARRAGLLVLGAAVTVLSAGCSLIFAEPSGDDVARDAVAAEATRIATEIDDSRPRNVLASDFAYRYSSQGSDVAVTGSARIGAEALSWDGMTRDEDGARFVLRITAHVEAQNGASFGSGNHEAGDASDCNAFRVFAFFEWTPTTADRVSCPEAPAMPPPSPAPIPALPDDAYEKLTAVLTAAAPENLESALADAFPDDSVPRNDLNGSHLTRESLARGRLLAAAVGISSTTDCVMGVRHADGTVRVWHPQDVTLAAGEAGCTVDAALNPVQTH